MTEVPSTKDASHLTDITAIEAIIAAQTAAWNRGDAKAFSERFAADGGFTNVLGMVYYGRDDFEQRRAEIFRTFAKNTKANFSAQTIRFIRDDVAIADVDCKLTDYGRLPTGLQATGDAVVRTKLQLVLVREEDGWWITAFHNVAVASPRH